MRCITCHGRPGARPATGLSFAARSRAMIDLIAIAFACDLTRVATFMLGNAGSNRSYRFIDVPQGHHDLSHHGGDAAKLAGIRAINRFHTEQFAAFLQRLQAIFDGEGSLLEQSLVVYASGISDGNRHNHDDLPVLVCGGGGGARKAGRHLALPHRTPMANLYLAIQRAMGVPGDAFADSTGALDLG